MKVGVMGTGAIGGYFGGLLALSGVDTHFVARGKHYRAILEEGLHIVSSQKTHHVMIHVTPEPDEIGPVDLLLFCVKSYDTDDAARLIEPMVEQDTVIISLQNGIDNQDKLIEAYGKEKVMAGTAFIEASIASPGVIAQMGNPGRIVFGELSGERSGRALDILHLFQSAGIDAELSSDISRVLWEKFLFICGIHGVSTLSRSSLGLVLAVTESRELVRGVMKEVEALAHQQGVKLPEDVVENAMALADGYHRNFKPSMLRDLEWRRLMEVDALNGMVVNLGRQLGIDTPLNHAIYACLNLENQKIANPVWAFQWEN
jgi:2-dehydropantoate 2-reductase